MMTKVTYGSESWTCDDRDGRIIEAAEMSNFMPHMTKKEEIPKCMQFLR
jgi:hypothetical protein